jgi:hypothetical protein
MAEIDDVLAELRQRIMVPSDSGAPKAVPERIEAVAPLPACGVLQPAMTQPVDRDQRHGSAAVALRRLAHPGRDGVQDAQASQPINHGRDDIAVEDDPASQISQLIRRLSVDMPELLEEVVALIERRTAKPDERDEGAAGKTTICLRFDARVLANIDADAKRMGITRIAWLHVAADERLEGRR